ncbi:uncharacterized protein EAF01_003555 [Botrytis porri]|uniref:uncharacterized protein n=1 Tax=Botrytis porri TaxID=87229 RepID=UPI0019000E58|nr:uncharacterized protein EAF01_003555 [Botrytis porri]KAF7909837.1 hypothetical protein EAF01_003555 [Botrytis porri]
MLPIPTLDIYHDRDSETESTTSELSSMGPAMREKQNDHDAEDQALCTMCKARRNYQNRLRYGSREIAFLDILGSQRGSGASDLRDMIYGHLAVADIQLNRAHESHDGFDTWPCVRNWSLQENIPVADHTKSVDDYFTEAARFTPSFRSADGLIKMLYHADVSASYTRRSGLPSWVPDWTLDKSSLQGLPWAFDDTDTRSTPGVTQAETWSLITKRRGLSKNVLLVDELAYKSARQKLLDCVKNMFTFEDRKKMSLRSIDVFRPIHTLWRSLGAKDIYPIPPKDLSFYPDIPASDELYRFIQNSTDNPDPSRSRNKPGPKFIVNISIIALRSRNSMDIFRGMKFARFRSGRVGVVPLVIEPGDFTLTEEKDCESQNCCMFRLKEDHKNEAYNLDIRADIDTGIEKIIPV